MSGESAKPWLADNLKKWKGLYNRIVQEFATDPHFAMLHLAGVTPSGTSEELHWPKPMSKEVEAAILEIYDHVISIVPKDLYVCHAISLKDPAAMRRIVDHCRKFTQPYLVKHNQLAYAAVGTTPSGWLNAPQNRLWVELVKLSGVDGGFEPLGSTLENKNGKPRLGTRDVNQMIKQAVVLAKQAGTSPRELFIEIYPPDLGAMKASVLG
jgi:hypothetical protein